ncbi:hypothetical protein KO481_35680, partial [Nocardia sp. NEAU-G5]
DYLKAQLGTVAAEGEQDRVALINRVVDAFDPEQDPETEPAASAPQHDSASTTPETPQNTAEPTTPETPPGSHEPTDPTVDWTDSIRAELKQPYAKNLRRLLGDGEATAQRFADLVRLALRHVPLPRWSDGPDPNAAITFPAADTAPEHKPTLDELALFLAAAPLLDSQIMDVTGMPWLGPNFAMARDLLSQEYSQDLRLELGMDDRHLLQSLSTTLPELFETIRQQAEQARELLASDDTTPDRPNAHQALRDAEINYLTALSRPRMPDGGVFEYLADLAAAQQRLVDARAAVGNSGPASQATLASQDPRHAGTTHSVAAADSPAPGARPAHLSTCLPEDPPLTELERELASRATDKLADFYGPGAQPSALLHRIDPADAVAASRARTFRNAAWWDSLTPGEQDAILRVEPHVIGNTDGVPYEMRDPANRLSLTRDIESFLERRPGSGWHRRRLTPAEHEELANLVAARDQLADVEGEAARQTGSPQVRVISLDVRKYRGKGRTVVSIGEPGTSATTAYLNGGTDTTLRSLRYRAGHALRLRAETVSIAPGNAMAAIVNIGYDHPADAPTVEAVSMKYAEAGGYETARDIAAYNATREYWSGGGPRGYLLTLGGHGYGSATVCEAGAGGRLAGEIDQVILTGSPGTGSMTHASEFGPGVRVYVLSSGRDWLTYLGAGIPGGRGRVLDRGLGLDPATEAWGAIRVAAEPPPSREFRLYHQMSIHQGYNALADPGTRKATVALHNQALIVAGAADLTSRAEHRPTLLDPTRLQRILSLPHDPERHRTGRQAPGAGIAPEDGTTWSGADLRAELDGLIPVNRDAAPALSYISGGLQELWRAGRKYATRWKPTTDVDWVREHLDAGDDQVRETASGEWEFNAAAYADEDMPRDGRAENAATALVAYDAIWHAHVQGADLRPKPGDPDLEDLLYLDEDGALQPDPTMIRRSRLHFAGEPVHDAWLDRNWENAPEHQRGDYLDVFAPGAGITPVEQYYDLIAAYLAHEFATAYHLDPNDRNRVAAILDDLTAFLHDLGWMDEDKIAAAVAGLATLLRDAARAGGPVMLWFRPLTDGAVRIAVHTADPPTGPWLTPAGREALRSSARTLGAAARRGGQKVWIELSPGLRAADSAGTVSARADDPEATLTRCVRKVSGWEEALGLTRPAAGTGAALLDPAATPDYRRLERLVGVTPDNGCGFAPIMLGEQARKPLEPLVAAIRAGAMDGAVVVLRQGGRRHVIRLVGAGSEVVVYDDLAPQHVMAYEDWRDHEEQQYDAPDMAWAIPLRDTDSGEQLPMEGLPAELGLPGEAVAPGDDKPRGPITGPPGRPDGPRDRVQLPRRYALPAELPLSTGPVAAVLRQLYGREMFRTDLGEKVTLHALADAADSEIFRVHERFVHTKYKQLRTVAGKLSELGPGSSAVVADISFTGDGHGFENGQLYVLHLGHDGVIRKSHPQTGEWLIPTPAELDRAPGILRHAIVFPPAPEPTTLTESAARQPESVVATPQSDDTTGPTPQAQAAPADPAYPFRRRTERGRMTPTEREEVRDPLAKWSTETDSGGPSAEPANPAQPPPSAAPNPP